MPPDEAMLDAIGKYRLHRNGRQRRGRRVVNGSYTSTSKTTMLCGPIIIISTMSTLAHRAQAARSRSYPTIAAIAGRRTLQGGNETEVVSSSIDLGSCIASLNASDVDSNDYLSQTEYLHFVQESANGTLDETAYGAPITQFYMLPLEYIGKYNLLACGSSSFGCPTVSGIDIGGMDVLSNAGNATSDAEEMYWLQLMSDRDESFWIELCEQYSRPSIATTIVPTSTTKPTTRSPATITKPTTRSPAPTKKPTARPPATTMKPTAARSPTTAGPNAAPSSPPTTEVSVPPPPCPTMYEDDVPSFVAGTTYEAGDVVVAVDDGGYSRLHSYYECESYPKSLYCGWEMYEPGNGQYWEWAWTLLERCVGRDNETMNATMSSRPSTNPTSKNASSHPVMETTYPPTSMRLTSSPSAPSAIAPTPAPAIPDENPDDPPYSGILVTTFQYEIFNTELLYAVSIMTGENPINDIMDIVVQSTNEFVKYVLDTMLGTGGDGDGIAVDDQAYPVRGGGRRLTVGGRRLAVTLESNSVSIDLVEDIECPLGTSSSQCQRVTASTQLTLTDEPKLATELRFQNSVSRALNDPGVTFPWDSGVVYIGPGLQSPVFIEISPPTDNSASIAPSEGGTNSTPGWVVPVSIGMAAAGAVAFLFLVGGQMQKRKKNEARAGSEARREVFVADISDSDGTHDEVLLEKEIEISPLDSPYDDLERGTRTGTINANPFLKINPNRCSPFTKGSDSDYDSSSDGTESSASSEMQQQKSQQTLPLESYRLTPLHDGIYDESYKSVLSDDKRMYRTAIVALVQEACPDKVDMIDEMMTEYEGREEVLLGNLSMMVATKKSSPLDAMQSTDVTVDEETNDVNIDDSSASSTSGSSDWSSNDDFSSVDSSIVTSEAESAAHAATTVITGSLDTSEPEFVPGGGRLSSACDDIVDEEYNMASPSKGGATENELDEAIQAGDWRAVSMTAALLANANSPERADSESFGVSQVSFSTHEQNQVEEFEKLVEQGDWKAVMAAASRFETASDVGSLKELRHSMDESLTSHEETISAAEDFDNQDELRAEIQELVRVVVPDELDNLDEMLLQYSGREEDLLATLRTMLEKNNMSEKNEGLNSSSSHSISNMSQNDGSASVFENYQEDSTIASNATGVRRSSIGSDD